MANIKQAFEYAAQNPDSEFATNLKQLAASGSLNQEAEKYGIDLSAFQPKKSVYENTVDKLSQRGANILEEVTRPTATPEMGTKAVRAIGQVGAGVGDIIGGGIEAVLKGADRLTGGGASETISEEGNALLNTDLGKQAVSALQMGMDKYTEWRQNNLDFAKNLEAVVNIASAVPVVKGAGALGKTAVEVGESAVAGAKTIPGQIKPITEGLMKKLGSPELSPTRAVGQIAQGTTEDIAPVAKALSIIDTKGVKTFDDLLGKTNSAIPTLAKQVDEELLKDAGVYSLDNLALSQTTKAGKVIKTDYVGRALDNLAELYKTTGDDVAKAEIDDVLSKATVQGLSRKEVNDISRLYGQEFGRKAFSKIGDPLTSVNAQAFENVRTGLKQVARNGIGGAEAKAIDEQLSALYDTQRLVEKNVEAVNKLKQRIQDRGILESITHTAFKALDTLSAGSIRGVIGGLLPRGAGYKTMNALDIEDALRGNLDIVEKALKSNSDEELAKILNKGFNQKSDLPSSSLIKNTTNKTNTTAKNVTMTETIPQKVKGATKNVEKSISKELQPLAEPITSVNPTGGVLVDYTPQARMTAPLGENMTTLANSMKKKPDNMITIYRGAPKTQKGINPGDFISTDRNSALSYAEDGNVISKKVRLGDILDDMDEPLGGDYLYRPGAFEEIGTKVRDITKSDWYKNYTKYLSDNKSKFPTIQSWLDGMKASGKPKQQLTEIWNKANGKN